MSDLKRLESIFLAAVELDGEARRRYLQDSCEGDPELLSEVQEMLAADAQGGGLFDQTVRSAVREAVEPTLEGLQLGGYRIVREIGRGGMGTVYLAERADDEFEKRVAIKVIKRGMDSADILQRFRHERRILAALEHPNIAQLLDGGSMPDGRPYLVMEFVDGEPLVDHCNRLHLNARERCSIFAKVCDAVAFAHRNLVVHRDLKPCNILVKADGTPKLLDFGIAKLIEPGTEPGQTMMEYRVLTPEYASPEQLLGLPVTTASDVYALGAVLFHLLAGSGPHVFTSRTFEDFRRTVCETATERPSRRADPVLAGQIHDELDRIVMMALRKEPERRYASVDQLREDIERHFSGRPVLAHGDSVGYRAGKFLRRHSWAVAAAAMVAASILGGSLVAVHEAKLAAAERTIAIAERDRAEVQRRNAESEHANAEAQRVLALAERDRAERESKDARAQRLRAEDRLQDIVRLANTSFYDVDDALSRAPGTIETRRSVIASALAYLDRLAAGGNADRSLTRAIALGYMTMGDALGAPGKPNIGDAAGAIKSYGKAADAMSHLPIVDDPELSVLMGQIQVHLAQRLFQSGERRTAVEITRREVNRSIELVRRFPKDFQVLLFQGTTFEVLSDVLQENEIQDAVAYSRRAVAAIEQAAAISPAEEARANHLGEAYSSLSQTLTRAGQLPEALVYAKKSLELREKRAVGTPGDVFVMRGLMMSYVRVAEIVGGPVFRGSKPDDATAREYYGKALLKAESILKADPNSTTAKEDYAIVSMRFGACYAPADKRDESITQLRKALALFDEELKKDPTAREKRINRVMNLYYLGRTLDEAGRTQESVESSRAAVEAADAVVASSLDSLAARSWAMRAYELLTRMLAKSGARAEAVEVAQRSIQVATDMSKRDPKIMMAAYPATTWARVAGLYDYMAALPGHDPVLESKAAADAYRKAIQALEGVVDSPAINVASRRDAWQRALAAATAKSGGK